MAAEIRELLVTLDTEQDIVTALAVARRLADAVGATQRLDAATIDELVARVAGDDVSALAAIEALAQVGDDAADAVLAELVDDPRPAIREHAVWRLRDRLPARHLYGRLVGRIAAGDFGAMIAQDTLLHWARVDPVGATAALDGALAIELEPAVRARLVDTLGAVEDPAVTVLLRRFAEDAAEDPAVRVAALGGLADRPDVDDTITRLAGEPGDLGAHAALVLDDRSDARPLEHDRTGLHVGQLSFVGDLDGQLSHGGTGDTGGVASLLVSTSSALARHADVAHVLTIGRGTITDVVAAELAPDEGRQGFAAVCVGPPGRRTSDLSEMWEHRLMIERGIRRVLRHRWHLDVLHLRMADVGTLATAGVAAEFGIPIAFSLAPDPHGVVRSMQAQGRVDRASFGELDQQLHVWFRARLVERLAREAAAIALFPRREPDRVFADLGLAPDQVAGRTRVVAEGVDVDALRRAEEIAIAGRAAVVEDVVRRIPAPRRGRPLLLSAGRLHPVKGMDRVVAAWAHDAELRERTNLVIVGGDLDDPSPTEREVLGSLTEALGGDPRCVDGLVLLGGRPRRDVHVLLAAARHGWNDVIAPGGVYVNGAAKEEFGLALVEALGLGLPVVAPSAGGPSTYVVDGDIGILVDPDGDLADGVHRALALVGRTGRADRARELVLSRYSIDAMANALVDLYRPVPAMR